VKRLLSRVLLGVAAGVAVYVAFSIWADAKSVGAALAEFSWTAAGLALLLAAANYLVRFVRWQYYLRVLALTVPAGESFLVFLGGFALTVTPGKLGEAIKALLLRESRGIPAARTAPIVVAERFTDLVGLLQLAAVGAFTFEVDRTFLIAAGVLIAVGLVVVSVEPLARVAIGLAARVPGVRKLAPKLTEFYASTAILLRPKPLVLAVVLSAVSWYFECLAFWLVVKGFPGAQIEHQAAVFIYATMTIAGALSFLPGGLGVTEAGMLTLLGKLGTGIGSGVAAAATFVTRLCTLWFAVVVGLAALVIFARKTKVKVELPDGQNRPVTPAADVLPPTQK
jgi:glycosyltransferase 2 family protein